VNSEGVDCPRPRHYLATVRHTARNQILFASVDRNAPSINQQYVAALHNHRGQRKLLPFLPDFMKRKVCEAEQETL